MIDPSRPFQSYLRFPESALAVPLFEDWLGAVDFPNRNLRDKVMLAGEELLDNIIRHSSPLWKSRVDIRLRVDGQSAFLSFRFRSSRFRSFVRNNGIPRAEYDPRDGRWRGLGLFMIASLTSRVRYHPGPVMDRIEVEF